jgi:hypothetical protein
MTTLVISMHKQQVPVEHFETINNGKGEREREKSMKREGNNDIVSTSVHTLLIWTHLGKRSLRRPRRRRENNEMNLGKINCESGG